MNGRRFVCAATGWLSLAVLVCCSTGCGTVFQGTKQTVRLTSDPSGAEVVDGKRGLVGVTPIEAELSRGVGHKLTFNKPGYSSVTVPMTRHAIFMWWALDSLSLGVGNLIDAATGALFEIRPKKVHVVLDPEGQVPPK